MILVQRGKVRLTDPVSRYIPELKGEGRERVTIEQLLTHVSGYAPDFDLRERWSGHDEAIKRLIAEPLRNPPGTRFTYSDIGYIALGEVVGRVSGMPLDEFAKKNIFEPLKMRDTGFRPDASLQPRIAPTEKRRGQLNYLGDSATNIGVTWIAKKLSSLIIGGTGSRGSLAPTRNAKRPESQRKPPLT